MKKVSFIVGASIVMLALFLGACAIWGAPWKWNAPKEGQTEAAESTEPPTEVTVSEEKFANMKLRCVPVEKRVVSQERPVWGKIEYRRIHRVELKAPVDSVVQKVLVKPGDAVKNGTRLALLTSPDVGLARAEVEKSKSDLEIATKALDWAEEITDNLDELLVHLRDKPEPDVVEREFEEKVLGDYRQEVLPAYARYNLAEQLWTAAEELVRRGGMSQKTRQERETGWRVAKEGFRAVCEQSQFDAVQACKQARQKRTFAMQLVEVSQQKLQTLLGAYGRPAGDAENGAAADSDKSAPGMRRAESGAALTRFDLIAPFDGTVELRLASDAQRVAAGTLLFAVANTDVLEVTANLREGDWRAVSPFLEDGHGHKLKIRVPSLGNDREFEATVDYVGRAVDPATQAVPLVALLDNSRHEFKPGMTARITLVASEPSEEIIVPPAAVRTHDGQSFVFVETAPRTYKRVAVAVGRESEDWVAITSGLSVGEVVVAEGSDVLKNELLLPFTQEE